MIRSAFDPFAPKTSSSSSSSSAPAAEHGKVYVCGSTEHAAAGHAGPAAAPPKAHSRQHHHEVHHTPLRTPHLLTTLIEAQVAQVSCGWRHSALVLADGELYACGDNEYGKCGFGDTAARSEPTRVPIPLQAGAPPSHVVRVSTVSCGRSHSAFVCTAGELYTFGLGLYGQLGHRTLTAQTAPRRVDGLGGAAVSVSCGGLHTLVVRADGRALSCGFHDAGRLGRPVSGRAGASAEGELAGGEGAQPTGEGGATAGGASASEVLEAAAPTLGGAPALECSARFEAVLLHGAASASDAVVAVAAGGAHSAFVLADGAVYTCGRGECGQLGHGVAQPEPAPRRLVGLKGSRVRRAAAGEAHSLFLTSAGVPYACGAGGFGRLGLGGRASVLTPSPVGALAAHVVVQISAGDTHSAFVTEAGAVFMCGDDSLGQCGLHGGSGAHGGAGAASALLPQTPPKLARDGVHVLGVSCGGAHTGFVLRAVVDAREDYREDQVEMAATVIESFFRGAHVRAVREAAAARHDKKAHRSAANQAQQRRDASVRLLQSQWRVALRARAAERNAQLERMRGLHDPLRDEPVPGWGRAKAQLDAALVGAAFSKAAEGANLTKASW